MRQMRIKFKKSSILVKVIVAILIIYAMVTLIYLQRQLSEKQYEREALQNEIAQVQQANADLRSDIEKMDTEEGIKDAAREKLGLVSEGEITFYDIGN